MWYIINSQLQAWLASGLEYDLLDEEEQEEEEQEEEEGAGAILGGGNSREYARKVRGRQRDEGKEISLEELLLEEQVRRRGSADLWEEASEERLAGLVVDDLGEVEGETTGEWSFNVTELMR